MSQPVQTATIEALKTEFANFLAAHPKVDPITIEGMEETVRAIHRNAAIDGCLRDPEQLRSEATRTEVGLYQSEILRWDAAPGADLLTPDDMETAAIYGQLEMTLRRLCAVYPADKIRSVAGIVLDEVLP
jgi:hypothetical protein